MLPHSIAMSMVIETSGLICIAQERSMAIMEVNHSFCLFKLEGNDVAQFLQGQLCSDVTLLSPNSSQLTGICNAKGRLVASPFLLKASDDYYLALTPSIVDILTQYWRPFLMLSRVKLVPHNIKHMSVIDTTKQPSRLKSELCIDLPVDFLSMGDNNYEVVFLLIL